MATQVFVAEDHPVYRQGLVESIRERAELELVGVSADGREALDNIRELQPDVAVLDLRLPELDAIGVLRELQEDPVPTRVVLLSAYSDGALIYEALEAGAAGYLSKDAAADQICAALVAAVEGETVLSEGLDQRLARQIAHRNGNGDSQLSARETEILELMAEGLSSTAIGAQLNLSQGTVKTYIRRAYEKLGVSSRAAAIAEAMRRGTLS
jgi:two-component system, NarL family, nitrate/nitrite response regulator NarL